MDKILFLGTGAADWKLEHKGEYFRRDSSALINNDLLIDPGPHVADFINDFHKQGVLDGVTHMLITHPHDDHMNKNTIAQIAKKNKITLCCAACTKEILGEIENVEYLVLNAFETVKCGAYTVTPVPANHCGTEPALTPFHYIVKTPNGKTFFYGLDGAWVLGNSLTEMQKHKFDLMVLDATVGEEHKDFYWLMLGVHNSIPMLRILVKEFKMKGFLTENGKIVGSHLSKNFHVSKAETEKMLADFGMITAADGMELKF